MKNLHFQNQDLLLARRCILSKHMKFKDFSVRMITCCHKNMCWYKLLKHKQSQRMNQVLTISTQKKKKNPQSTFGFLSIDFHQPMKLEQIKLPDVWTFHATMWNTVVSWRVPGATKLHSPVGTAMEKWTPAQPEPIQAVKEKPKGFHFKCLVKTEKSYNTTFLCSILQKGVTCIMILCIGKK